MANGDARKQHYTPRLLLRAFAVERKPGKFQIGVFDKHTGTTFRCPIEDIAAERDFNTLETDSHVFSWETRLGDIEDMAAPVIDRVRKQASLEGVGDSDKASLAIFAAAQFIRGTDYRARYSELCRAIAKRAVAIAGEKPVAPEILEAGSDQDTRIATLRALQDNLTEFAQHFANKQLMLLEAPSGSRFLIGDSPVTMFNKRTFGPYGNMGLAVLGIQLYLPISTSLTLGFWCLSHREEYEQAIREGQRDLQRSRGFALLADAAERQTILTARKSVEGAIRRMSARIADLDIGKSEKLEADHVEHMNSLQVANAERFVMSVDGTFDLVRRMIGDNPRYKTGQRISMD